MDADHKKHKKQDNFATVDSKRTFGQSVPIEACVGCQPITAKQRSISKVTSWRDKRLYYIQKVNLSPRPTEVDLSTLPE